MGLLNVNQCKDRGIEFIIFFHMVLLITFVFPLLRVVFPTSDQEPIQKYAFVYCWGIL